MKVKFSAAMLTLAVAGLVVVRLVGLAESNASFSIR
jgi:hypothetical protein